jgi:hypothetical protein
MSILAQVGVANNPRSLDQKCQRPEIVPLTVVMENNSDGGLGFRSLPRRYRPPVPQNLLNVFSEHATHSDD